MNARNRRKFTPELKAEAVAMVEAAGGNIAKVARELGIYDSTLGNWVHKAREEIWDEVAELVREHGCAFGRGARRDP
jgi:transposase-like protein